MNTTLSWRSRTLRVALLGVLGLAANAIGPAWSQGTGAPVGAPAVSPLSPTAPPELVKPAVPPSQIDNPEAVFSKLDAGKRGYVTSAETKDLLGFENAFKAVDTQGSGKLTLAQFKKAWAIYREKK